MTVGQVSRCGMLLRFASVYWTTWTRNFLSVDVVCPHAPQIGIEEAELSAQLPKPSDCARRQTASISSTASKLGWAYLEKGFGNRRSDQGGEARGVQGALSYPIWRYRTPSASRGSLPPVRFPSRYTEIETGPWNITGSFGSDEIRQ